MRFLVWMWLFVFLALSSAESNSAEETLKPFGLSKRVPWTTSKVVGTPDPPPPYRLERAFPQLSFAAPVYIVQEPGTDRLLVAEHGGKIYAFTPETKDNESRELFLDINRKIYSFSFHPNYKENGVIFVFSPTANEVSKQDSTEKNPETDSEPDAQTDTSNNGDQEKDSIQTNSDERKETEDTNNSDEPKEAVLEKKAEDQRELSRVSRYTTNLDHPRRCLSDSEQVIIEWPSGGHNGGEAIIGPDGYLYVSTGDGTSGSDPDDTGQGVDDLLSVIMRIDVDHADPTRPYLIPEDNPFVNDPDARPEIWCFGLRNPWRMCFDKQGQLWVGDVGQDLWEMIWLIQRGGNYGWSVQEGSHPFHPHKKTGPGPILPPVAEHHHTECRSITGGYVYEGDKFPELKGVYFYGDYEYGKIWGLRYDGKKVTWQEELADSPQRIASFGVSRDGNILIVDHAAGEIYQLERTLDQEANSKFPRKLSDTGIFESVVDHRVAPGVIPYSVNTAQWIDHATKQRFLALPDQSKVGVATPTAKASDMSFGDGTVTLETISLEMETGESASRRRIETRMMVRQQGHWLGYSYLWNKQQTDATLVDALGTEIQLTIQDPSATNGRRQQTWRVPSRNECMVCHSRAAKFVLGLNSLQLNKDHDYGGVIDNQLRTFSHIGVFDSALPEPPEYYDALPNAYDKMADLQARARAYLDVNCSVCHVSDGGGNAKIVLNFGATLAEMSVVGKTPLHGDFGLPNAKIVDAGDPFNSVLMYRLSKLGRGRMPHIGSRMTDQEGLDLIHDWILLLAVDEEDHSSEEASTHNDYLAAVRKLSDDRQSDTARLQTIQELLSTTRGASIMARLVAVESTLESIDEQVTTLAVTHSDANVRDLFERFIPENQRTKRLGDTIDPMQILSLTGNVSAGRELFFANSASQCKNCHRIQDSGGTLGPDLTQIGKKYKRHELLESLIEPSKRVDPKYAMYQLVTVEGKLLTGILVEKSVTEVVLNVLKDGQTESIRIPISQVDELSPQQKSLMPDSLLRDMTAQQAANLLDYLYSLK